MLAAAVAAGEAVALVACWEVAAAAAAGSVPRCLCFAVVAQ